MKNISGLFVFRFTLLHVLTYLFFGILFMFISDYFAFFHQHDLLKDIMLPPTALKVRLAPLVQIVRGLLLALAFYPFRSILRTRLGWLKLFFLLFVFSGIGAVITGPGSIEGWLYTRIGFINPLIGLPEIILQMLTFSYFLYRWEKQSEKPVEKTDG